MSDTQVCDGRRSDPATGAPILVRPPHGCYRCCDACASHGHLCPGCGGLINHGVDVCLVCRNTPGALTP